MRRVVHLLDVCVGRTFFLPWPTAGRPARPRPRIEAHRHGADMTAAAGRFGGCAGPMTHCTSVAKESLLHDRTKLPSRPKEKAAPVFKGNGLEAYHLAFRERLLVGGIESDPRGGRVRGGARPARAAPSDGLQSARAAHGDCETARAWHGIFQHISHGSHPPATAARAPRHRARCIQTAPLQFGNELGAMLTAMTVAHLPNPISRRQQTLRPANVRVASVAEQAGLWSDTGEILRRRCHEPPDEPLRQIPVPA